MRVKRSSLAAARAWLMATRALDALMSITVLGAGIAGRPAGGRGSPVSSRRPNSFSPNPPTRPTSNIPVTRRLVETGSGSPQGPGSRMPPDARCAPKRGLSRPPIGPPTRTASTSAEQSPTNYPTRPSISISRAMTPAPSNRSAICCTSPKCCGRIPTRMDCFTCSSRAGSTPSVCTI